MDGENHGKPLLKWDNLGGNTPIFGSTPICLHKQTAFPRTHFLSFVNYLKLLQAYRFVSPGRDDHPIISGIPWPMLFDYMTSRSSQKQNCWSPAVQQKNPGITKKKNVLSMYDGCHWRGRLGVWKFEFLRQFRAIIIIINSSKGRYLFGGQIFVGQRKTARRKIF